MHSGTESRVMTFGTDCMSGTMRNYGECSPVLGSSGRFQAVLVGLVGFGSSFCSLEHPWWLIWAGIIVLVAVGVLVYTPLKHPPVQILVYTVVFSIWTYMCPGGCCGCFREAARERPNLQNRQNQIFIRNAPNSDLADFALVSTFHTGWRYLCSIVY